MIDDAGEGTRGEPLVSYHRKLVGKELSYLEVHDQSVMQDFDHIIGAYDLLSCLLRWIPNGGCSDLLYYGEEEKRWWLRFGNVCACTRLSISTFLVSKSKQRNVKQCPLGSLQALLSSSDYETLHLIGDKPTKAINPSERRM